MTATVKEELAKIIESTLAAIEGQTKFEDSLEEDLASIERTLRQLEGRRGNEPMTAEVGQTMVDHLRKASRGNMTNAKGTHILMILLLKVSLLMLREGGSTGGTPEEAMKELEWWLKEWNVATKAWEKYLD